MMITLLLDKKKQYHMKDLTMREKITLMEEMHGKGTSTIRYVNGAYRSQVMGVVYLTDIGQWRAQFNVNMAVAESLAPIIRGGFKREYKNSQFIVI